MKYSELKTLARSFVPQATVEQINDDTLALLLRQGALDVAMRLHCLKTDQKFSTVEDQRRYTLSSVLTRFLEISDSGVWWSEDGSDNYIRLIPTTIKWLDENRPNWRTEAAGAPVYYAFDADELILAPPASETTSEALWAFFSQIPPTPDNDDWYPFGGETEIPRLAVLSDTILYYYKWKALGILGKSNEMDAFKPSYIAEVLEKQQFLNRRKDISSSSEAKLQGKKIR